MCAVPLDLEAAHPYIGRTGTPLHQTLDALRSRGWTVSIGENAPLLTYAQQARYPSAPAQFTAFLGGILACHSPREQCWLYGPREYRVSDPKQFRWNECELMSLEAHDDDAAGAGAVRAFWDRHIPFMMAAHSDYDYLALRLGPQPGVVHGFAPEFEEPSLISDSFEAFLEQLHAAARAIDPPWPFRLFLEDAHMQ